MSDQFRLALSRRGHCLAFDRVSGQLCLETPGSLSIRVGFTPTSPELRRLDMPLPTLPGTPIVARPIGDGPLCQLHAADGPLGVTEDGMVAVGSEPEPWLLVASTVIETLVDLDQGSWIAQSRRALLPRGLVWAEDFVAALGPQRIDLARSAALVGLRENPDELFVLDENARIECLMRYSPVVAYAAFGSDMLFRCLEASLYSLSRVGRFDGRVVIMTDRPAADVEMLVPGEMRDRTTTYFHTGADTLDWALSRYELPKIPAAQAGRPLLYLDTDVIVDARIETLLTEIALTRRVCVFPEDDLFHPVDFYGKSLFENDPTFEPASRIGFSTGVLGIADPRSVADVFASVRVVAEADAVRRNSRVSASYDQSPVNYIFHKLAKYDEAVLLKHETNCNGRDPDPGNRRGLAHFAGGVGNAGPKLPRMQAYLDLLLQSGPSG